MRVDFDVAGQRAQRGGLHLFADGEDDAAGAVRQCGDALLVKRKLIVDNRAQRDVDKRLRGFLHTHFRRADGRADESIVRGGKRVGARLKFGRGIDNRIQVFVILNDIQHALDRITRRLQALDFPADFRHGDEHAKKLSGALLHDFRGIAVEGERRCGGHERNGQLFGDEFAPERHRIRDDAIRRKRAHVAQNRVVERQRGIDEHLGGKSQISA